MTAGSSGRPLARAGARLVEFREFGANPGALRMLAYLPPTLAPGAPLVTLLHGCGQEAESFAAGAGWLDLADRHGFAVLCPAQVRANNRGRCFNWFEPADAALQGGEAASILRMIDHLAREAGSDRGKIYAAGLSAGGAMAVALLALAPDRFAGGAVFAGMPYAAARGMAEAWLVMNQGGSAASATLAARARQASGHKGPWPPLSVWQGLADTTVSPANARQIAGQWQALNALPTRPSRTAAEGGRTRQVWETAAGQVALELNLIAGMGHGAPVAAAIDGGGRPGPFLLETGVAAAREVIGVWGLDVLAPPPPEAPAFAAPRRAARPPAGLAGLWARLTGRR